MRSPLETCSAVRTTPCTASRCSEAVRYCENTGSDLRHLHFHEIRLATARCDEAKRFGSAGRCNRMGLTLPHVGASSEAGDPIGATSSDSPTHKSRTADCSNEGEGDHTLLWLLAEARPEAMAELSFLPTPPCRVLRSLGSRGHRIG